MLGGTLKLPHRVQSPKQHLVHLRLKLASGESNFSAFHEIIVLAHKPERFDGANCKKEDAN